MGECDDCESEKRSLAKAIFNSYNNEREQLDKAIQNAGYIGLSLRDFYRCSVREFTMLQFGAMKKIEENINNKYSMAKYMASQISLAVWGDTKFKNGKVPRVDLTSKILPDSDKRRVLKAQKETLERIKRQYGVDLTSGGIKNG